MNREQKAVSVLRRLLGVPIFLFGLLLLGVEFLWTTTEHRALPILPPPAADALMFLLGLTGMLLIYLGFRMVMRKRP
jgi:apolipoprotein N-acyltransferase